VARVEWTRLNGDDVEAVVGMFICSEFPNAVRVRPSQGDGGVDVFVPGEGGFAVEREVYQVKKYTENLTSSQKREITRSYKRVIAASEKEGWKITKWHLVMPLDLTDHNLANWLKNLTADAQFPCETHGLLYCDTAASRYTKVVDYYLRDGKEQLEGAIAALTNMLAGRPAWQETGPLSVRDVSGDLASLYHALNDHDPFYKYEFDVSDTPPSPEVGADRPGLVAVWARCDRSVWITVRIIALSMAAIEERPVKWHLKFTIPTEDEELRQQFEKFVDYGAPVNLPAGTVGGVLDLPGGLGGELSGGSFQVLSVSDDDPGAESAEIAIATVDPDSDTVIARTVMRRVEFTTGQAGVRSVWHDTAGLFTIETLVADGKLSGSMHLSVEYNLKNRKPAELVSSLKFIATMHAPNRIALGLPYGPGDFGVVTTATWEVDEFATFWAELCESLALIQEHVNVLLRMPEEVSVGEAKRINDVAKLLRGEVLSSEGLQTFTVHHDGDQAATLDWAGIYEFFTVHTMSFRLGGATISAGKKARLFRGRYLEIGEAESTIEPDEDGQITMRYLGELDTGQVQTRQVACDITRGPNYTAGGSE
jgi:hypothetical protein